MFSSGRGLPIGIAGNPPGPRATEEEALNRARCAPVPR